MSIKIFPVSLTSDPATLHCVMSRHSRVLAMPDVGQYALWVVVAIVVVLFVVKEEGVEVDVFEKVV